MGSLTDYERGFLAGIGYRRGSLRGVARHAPVRARHECEACRPPPACPRPPPWIEALRALSPQRPILPPLDAARRGAEELPRHLRLAQPGSLVSARGRALRSDADSRDRG